MTNFCNMHIQTEEIINIVIGVVYSLHVTSARLQIIHYTPMFSNRCQSASMNNPSCRTSLYVVTNLAISDVFSDTLYVHRYLDP